MSCCYPVLCLGESPPRLVGIWAVSFVGKVKALNCKLDKARNGAVVSINVHAFWSWRGGAHYMA